MLADGRQFLGFAVAEQFGPERDFLGSHRLGRNQLGEVALGTAGLEVHAKAIPGRLRFGDDMALRIHDANGGITRQTGQLERDAVE